MKRVLLFLVVLVLTGLTATAAFADNQPAAAAPAPVKITLTAAPGQNGAINLTAKVNKADGGIAGNLSINFAVTADVFGQRKLALGAATTDSSGTATLVFTPTWNGPAHFTATFVGNATYGANSAAADSQLKSVQPAYTNAPPALSAFRRSAGLGALALVAAVWVLLVTVVVRVLAGVARGKDDPVALSEELSAD